MTPTRERAPEDAEPAPERSPLDYASDARETAAVLPLPSGNGEEERMDEDSVIEVGSEAGSEEEEEVVDGVRSVAVSPAKEDILDRVAPSTVTATAQTRASNPSLSVDVLSSPYRSTSSPRYRHGRRLLASDVAVPSSRSQNYAAGVTTVQADRYRMNRSSGKRLWSPAKRTALWDDLCNSYIHQSSAGSNTRDAPTFSQKRLARSAAEQAFGGSSVFRTLNMDTYDWPRSNERQRVVTGPEAMSVANQAAREFLGVRHEESKQSEPPVQSRQRIVENGRMMPAIKPAEDVFSSGSSNRKGKRVSFGGKNTYPPQPRTLPVLADKTTQTDDSLLQVRTDRKQRSAPLSAAPRSPARCSACDTSIDDSERPKKISRGPETLSTPAQERNYRRTSSSFSQHLTNPILLNPRYPPEPTTFRGRSTYSSSFNNRLAWR
ncbi:unnamed protein product [Phytophthora fragariaefolia]|uniref:Unnamed protein product n=1 Tax=Phytophthora fragariaefolia TaxID=1490495 RepID=A0A9W6X509_9STRA|nr:unnamed protein product [Phytophthora fragariaefolia]